MLWHLVQHQNLSWWSGTSTWDRRVYRVVDWILQKGRSRCSSLELLDRKDVTCSCLRKSKFCSTCSLKFKSHLEGQNIFGRSLINLGRSKSSIWPFHMRIHEGGNQPVAFGLSQKWVRRIKIIHIWQLIILEESLRQITFEQKSSKLKTKGGVFYSSLGACGRSSELSMEDYLL